MQEARGTARALREEVGQLKTGQERQSEEAPPVDSMLDALDGAIDMMSALEAPSAVALGHGKDRRGRIDIAALLFDLAPNAKISIEPGAGTEVFGVETELRRVLDVLLRQSGSDTGAAAIEVRRNGEWVVVSVAIGPEGMSTRDLEHRWLNRMAGRQGGRLELAGNLTRLCLPADASSGQQEILQLRKELEQAQQLGAVYARELAEAFAVSGETPAPTATSAIQPNERQLQVLVSTASAIVRPLRATTDALRQDIAKIGRSLGDNNDAGALLNSRLVAYGEIISDLERITQVSLDDPPRLVDLPGLLREVIGAADVRARRHHVALSLDCPSDARTTTRPQVFSLLIRSLVDQAILATPKMGSVAVVVDDTTGANALHLRVVDGGPIVPSATYQALLAGEVDPATIGRPAALSWVTAGACIVTLGVGVDVGETSDRRSEVRLALR
ncbi:MAG TPA: hypothetical protein VKP30_13065 [Polyangiaceae bacterium]|nr:hypothetical protein [Polyangiaceae bacterium]